MVSYIVCTEGGGKFKRNLLASWEQVHENSELIVVHSDSIARAYNEGIKKAKNEIKCFIHDDVVILDPFKLETGILVHRVDYGMMGVIGTVDPDACPWWDGKKHIGSLVDSHWGLYNFGTEGGDCAFLDGVLLATDKWVWFDEKYPGFHMYDQDICKQMLTKGWKNFCLPEGHKLIVHNCTEKNDTKTVAEFSYHTDIYREKWEVRYCD